ncbi:MAG: outer membrane protein assembly factor BamD [Ignavibacteria bacterium]
MDKRMHEMRSALLIAFVIALAVVVGCSSKDVVTGLSADERFQRAKALFDDGDYLEAIQEFNIITVQHSGSSLAAEAQYYIAEARFQRKEYLLASYEYQTLRRNMPTSPKAAEAMYKIGLCYYYLSPKSCLDQQYTKRAIDELQAFVEYYPKSEYVADATEKIRELTTRLAKRDFETAELYAKMDSYKSAIFYYDLVIEKYHDTEYAPMAYLAKTELLISRRKYREAKAEITRFIEKYPSSVLRGRADKLNAQIDEALKREPAARGNASGSTSSGSRGALLLQSR